MTFHLLGPVEIDAGGRAVDPGEPRRRAVLAVLLLDAGRAVSSEALIDRVWDGEPPPKARATLQSHITRVRRTLAEVAAAGGPAARLVREPGGYRLDVDPDAVDLHRRRRLVARSRTRTGSGATRLGLLREAVALGRGEPLSGIRGGWVRRTREHLVEEGLAVVVAWADAEVEAGDPGSALAEVSALADENPLVEPLTAVLMRALVAAGRPTEALQRCLDHRQRLADEYGTDQGPELRALYEQTLRSDRPDVPVPAVWEPPAVVGDFVGRAKEVDLLRTLLSGTGLAPGACAVVTITGAGGVGKTTLAVQAAHETRQYFPDGCLYADLRGTDPEPARAGTVLASFLRSLGMPPDAVPAEPDERGRLYRSLLAGKRVLVVADNAADEDQVRPLIPGAGCGLVVTSRGLLAGLAGAQLVVAEALPAQDAVRLLRRVAGPERVPEPGPAERIVDLCGGLPLAIRIAAVRLVRRGDMSAAQLAERLGDERRRLDELAVGDLAVRASLELSYQRLDAPAARLLRLIAGTALVTVTSRLAGALLDVPRPRADRILEELAARHLLIPASYDRYRVHDLVRLHARERADDDETPESRSAAIERVARHLLAAARRANQRLPCRPLPVPPGDDRDDLADHEPVDAVAWFEAETANLVAVFGMAAGAGRGDLAVPLATAAANFWMMRGYLDEWESTHRAVLATGDPHVLLGLASLHRLRDRNDAALPLLRTAYRKFRRAGDPLGAAGAALSWAVCGQARGRTRFAQAAMRVVAERLDLVDPAEPLRGYALLTMRDVLADGPEAERANLEQALAVFEATGEHWGAAEAHTLLGAALRRAGQPETAAVHLNRAVAMYTRFGDRFNALVATTALAETHVARHRWDSARRLVTGALSDARELRHRWAEATALRLSAELDLADRRPAEAIHHLDASVLIFRRIGQPVALARALDQLGRAYLMDGDRRAATGAAREAYEIFTRLQPPAAADVSAWMAAAGLG